MLDRYMSIMFTAELCSSHCHIILFTNQTCFTQLTKILLHVEPLLCNDHKISKCTRAISRQRLNKHVPMATDTHATIEVLLETVFYTWPVQRGYKRDNWSKTVLSRVEVGSNTPTIALQVIGGNEKGSLESGTVKYGHESHRTRTREWLLWQRPAAIVNDKTHPLLREGAPHQQTRNCLTVIKLWSYAPDGCFITRQTGWVTIGCNIRLRLKIAQLEGSHHSEGTWTHKQRSSHC
jgi:hypothetical protein